MENDLNIKKRKSRVSQTDVPAYSLTDALRVAHVLNDEFARQPVKPLLVAQGLDVKPTSSRFRMIAGASIAYGLTTGGYNASEIALTDLGKRCVSPTYDGEDVIAQREALLTPRIISEFLKRYDGSRFPSSKIGENVLIDMGIARDSAAKVYSLIRTSAELYGLTKEIKNELYVDLSPPALIPPHESVHMPDEDFDSHVSDEETALDFESLNPVEAPTAVGDSVKRVFITHGKNKQIAEQLKELLKFGKFEPVLSVDHETLAKPVPQKVMDDMRSCSAAVIHVGAEQCMLGTDGSEISVLNQNVLIEIGASMALYGQRFILLVENGTELPSNLQGLYEVRYEGEKLDYDATMKLLKAFNDFTQ